MTVSRIISFLPSATELLYEFGEQEKIFGVTHECKYPEEAKTKPQVISSAINSDTLTSIEINDQTCKFLNEGKEIFLLNEENIRKARPDLIISQETCEACAAYTNQVIKTIQLLQNKPHVFSMNPHNLEEIIFSVTDLGKILQKEDKAEEIVFSLKKRIQRIRSIENNRVSKVLAIEWIEPFFTAGHWIPEMVNYAGGLNMISKSGESSRRLSIEEIIESDPDIIIMMPCGFDVDRTILEYNKILKNQTKWRTLRAVKNNKIFCVDANSFFSKPSIRTITGLEILAKIIQPEKTFDIKVPENSFLQMK